MEKFNHFILTPSFMMKMDSDCCIMMSILMNEFSLLQRFNSSKIVKINGIDYIPFPFEKAKEKTSLTKNKIIGAVKGLIQAEYIYVENKGKKNELFTINFELIHLIDEGKVDFVECNKVAREKNTKEKITSIYKSDTDESNTTSMKIVEHPVYAIAMSKEKAQTEKIKILDYNVLKSQHDRVMYAKKINNITDYNIYSKLFSINLENSFKANKIDNDEYNKLKII